MNDFIGNIFDEYKLSPEVIPGILEQEWVEIQKKIEIVMPFAKTIHIDLLDGKFAPNTTFIDPGPFAKYTKDIFFEVHMMVENPLQYLASFKQAGFKRFIGHIEKMPDVAEFVAEAQLVGEVGLAIDTATPIQNVTISYDDLDVLFVMTVNAGYSRQEFQPAMLQKVKEIRSKSATIPIEIDGGVSDTTIVAARQAGATRFVTTKFVYDTKNPEGQYKTLCGLVK